MRTTMGTEGQECPRRSDTVFSNDSTLAASSPAVELAVPLVPTSRPPRVGRYVYLEPLASGGMGQVFAAYDEKLDRKVAIKQILHQRGDDISYRLRMESEARAMARIAHNNVVVVHEVGEHEGQLFVAMEYVPGLTLKQWMTARDPDPQPWQEVIEIFLQAGRGLAAAHTAGLTHRDFKPGNVMIRDDGVVKVLDFGLVRLAEPSGDTVGVTEPAYPRELTAAGWLGTPQYMAPEQFDGMADARSDQFSYCVSLYEALYGQRPHTGLTFEQLALHSVDAAAHIPPVEIRIPKWLDRVVRRGLAADPDDRFADMHALLAELAPAPRRRRLLVAALMLPLAGALGMWMGSEPLGCEVAEDEMARVWNPTRRAQIGHRLTDTGVAYAADARDYAFAMLDTYADAWTHERLAACESRVTSLDSPELSTVRLACLEQRRAAFDTVVQLLEQVDDTTIVRVQDVVDELPQLTPCSQPATLLAAVAPPRAEDAEAVAHARTRLARARVHRNAGDLDLARAYVDGANALVASLDYSPITSEIALERGAQAMEIRDPETAETLLTEAIAQAVAIDHVAVAAEATARRIFVRGYLSLHPDQALADEMWLHALSARHTDPEQHWLAANNLAVVVELRDPETALQHYREAIAIRVAGGLRDSKLASTKLNLANLLIDHARLPEAETTAEEAYALAQEVLGPSHPRMMAFELTNILLLQRIGRRDDARAALDDAIGRHQQAGNTQYPWFPRLLWRRAELSLEQSRFAAAQADAAAALEILADGTDLAVRYGAQTVLGDAKIGLGQADEGIEIYTRVLKDATAVVGEEAQELSMILLRMGRAQRHVGDLEAARETGRRAVELVPERGPDRIAAMTELAVTLKAAGELTAAATELDEAIAYTRKKMPSTHILGRLLSERAAVHLEQSHPQQAQKLATEAIALLVDAPELAQARSVLARTRVP